MFFRNIIAIDSCMPRYMMPTVVMRVAMYGVVQEPQLVFETARNVKIGLTAKYIFGAASTQLIAQKVQKDTLHNLPEVHIL